jgi:hypothetical protein
MEKNIFTNLAIGLKKGYNTPTLPENILKIQLHPLIRILRVLGGLSFLFVLSKNHLNFHIFFLYIAMLFMLLFTIYHIIISYYRLRHIRKLFKSGELDNRN